MQKWKRLLHSNLIIISCIISVVVALATVGETWGLGKIVDILSIKKYARFLMLVCFVIGMVVLEYFGNTINIWFWEVILQKTKKDLRLLLCNKILTTEYKDLQLIHSGNLNSIFISDVEGITKFQQTLLEKIGGVTAAMISIFVCGSISWKFFVICMLTFPVLLGLGVLFNKPLQDCAYQSKKSMGKSAEDFLNYVQNRKLIQTYSVEKYILKKYSNILDEEKRSVLKELRVRGKASMLNRMTGAIPYITIFLTGAALIWNGEITLGEFFAFAYIFSNIQSIQDLQEILSSFKEYKASKKRIFEILELPDEEKIQFSKDNLNKQTEDGFYIENMSFSYHRERTILENVNLHVNPGQIVVITGKSGGGKSTLLHLIMGLYRVSKGRIYLCKEGRELSAEEYKKEIGVVFQNNFLFSGTIAENIRMGNPQACESDIIEACKKAGIWRDISAMPKGLQTVVSEMGTSLSGGQRQRICIARALIKKPYILIMDEPSASLDSYNEKEIMNQLAKSMNQGILIIVSHRETTLKYANVIYEVKNAGIDQISQKRKCEI